MATCITPPTRLLTTITLRPPGPSAKNRKMRLQKTLPTSAQSKPENLRNGTRALGRVWSALCVVTRVEWHASNSCREGSRTQERCDGIYGICRAQVPQPRNLQEKWHGCENTGMVCRRSVVKSRFERCQAVCLHDRRFRKSETHSQQSAREGRAMRHARQSAWRVDRCARGHRNRRSGGPRNATAQQKIFPVETVAGIFRVLQPARTNRLRDSSGVNRSDKIATNGYQGATATRAPGRALPIWRRVVLLVRTAALRAHRALQLSCGVLCQRYVRLSR